jgi:predicted TPR repeat methyltransferase
MNKGQKSLTPGYFDALYVRDADPWRFTTSKYEKDKYAASLTALNDRSFNSAFEVGCSIGILTRQLASRCKSLLAVDVVQRALDQAQRNCENLDNIQFARMQIPSEWPTEDFDLIVLSEVLYYFSAEDIALIAEKTLLSLLPRGMVLLVHWTGETDYPYDGDEAVDYYLSNCGHALSPLLVRRQPEYRLDLLVRVS